MLVSKADQLPNVNWYESKSKYTVEFQERTAHSNIIIQYNFKVKKKTLLGMSLYKLLSSYKVALIIEKIKARFYYFITVI